MRFCSFIHAYFAKMTFLPSKLAVLPLFHRQNCNFDRSSMDILQKRHFCLAVQLFCPYSLGRFSHTAANHDFLTSSFRTEYKSCSMSLAYLSSAIICFISLLGFFSSVLKNSGYIVFSVSREIHSKYSGDPSSRNVLSSSSKSSGTFI